MISIQEANPLTVELYESYKKGGVSAEVIMNIHGMDSEHFSEWLEANNLKRVRFTVSSSSVEGKPKLLKENDISPERILQHSPNKLNSSRKVSESFFADNLDESLIDFSKPLKTTVSEDFVNLNTIIEEEKAANVIWLEEEHVKNTATIDSLTIEVELWKQKFEEERTLADNLAAKVSEWERRFSNQHEKHDIEVRNLKNENRKLNEALELHAHDESLLFGVMEKAVQMRGRVLETTEGGKNPWR